MIFRNAAERDINIITSISKEAFDTDILVGGAEMGGPPGYDSIKWHQNMKRDGHLFVLEDHGQVIGGAVLFKNEHRLYVGRIFISPAFFKRGYGIRLMQEIEKHYEDIKKINLETPIWNIRTNKFYVKCGYKAMWRDAESVFFEKAINREKTHEAIQE